MAKTNLKLYSTDGLGQEITTTINYANPEASKNDILAFTQSLNNLTKNTYNETEKITTVNVDLEPAPLTPTFTASQTQYSVAGFAGGLGNYLQGLSSILTYNGDGAPFVDKAAVETGIFALFEKKNGNLCFTPMASASNPPSNLPITFKVGFTETENYKACSVNITVTA